MAITIITTCQYVNIKHTPRPLNYPHHRQARPSLLSPFPNRACISNLFVCPLFYSAPCLTPNPLSPSPTLSWLQTVPSTIYNNKLVTLQLYQFFCLSCIKLKTRYTFQKVDIPNRTSLISYTVADDVNELGEGVFAACKELKRVILPLGLLRIGESALAFCSKLHDLSLPSSATFSGEMTFCNTSIRKLTILSGVTEIAYDTFLVARSWRTSRCL